MTPLLCKPHNTGTQTLLPRVARLLACARALTGHCSGGGGLLHAGVMELDAPDDGALALLLRVGCLSSSVRERVWLTHGGLSGQPSSGVIARCVHVGVACLLTIVAKVPAGGLLHAAHRLGHSLHVPSTLVATPPGVYVLANIHQKLVKARVHATTP
jgi:hypothetical protein